MKQISFIITLLISLLGYYQTQIGQDIDGEITSSSNIGGSVSASADGTIIAIGTPFNNGNGYNSGHVRVYQNINNIWTQIGQDIDGEAEDDFSGDSVSISSDGSVVAIGARLNDDNGTNSGHVRVYKNINNNWTQIGDDINGEAPGDQSGHSVSISSDGSIVAIGAVSNAGNGTESGHVRIYKNINNTWMQIGSDIDGEAAYNNFGNSVSISSDGSIVAIGANKNQALGIYTGHVRIYKNTNNVWTQIGTDIDGQTEGDEFGWSVSISGDGSIVAIGAISSDANGFKSGQVSIYKNINNVWNKIGSNINGEAAGDWFGWSVSISDNGSIVAIGSRFNEGNGENSGHVRIYQNINDIWTQIGTDIDGEAVGDQSGWSVSLSSNGSIVSIFAPLNGSVNGSANSGHVRVFDLSAVLSTESFNQDFFSYYPNPVKDKLNIELNNGLDLKQVNIYNIQSQYLYSAKTSKIDVRNLSSGIYFIEVETNKGKSAKKIVVE